MDLPSSPIATPTRASNLAMARLVASMTSVLFLRNSTITNLECSSMKKAAYRYPPNRETCFISFRSTCKSPGSGGGV